MYRKRVSIRTLLCSTVLSGVVMGAGWAGAQDAPETTSPAADDDAIDVIIVSGIRASQAQSLAMKRDSQAILDAITAEDIGKFPDKNVADALQRVPGIIIDRNGGEGSRVSVRGLSPDLTLSLLNGNFIASSAGEPSRSFEYTLLPSSLVQSVEVYKSSEARLEEGGVGGTIIVNSRKPFDVPSGTGLIETEGTWADTTRSVEPSVTGFYSWKNDSESFGLLGSITRVSRRTRQLSSAIGGAGWRYIRPDGVDANLDVNGDPIPNSTASFSPFSTAGGDVVEGVWIPQAIFLQARDEDRVRLGIQGTAQWRPVDRLTFTANYFSFDLKQDFTENTFWMNEEANNSRFLNSVGLDDDNHVVTNFLFTPGASGQLQNINFPAIIGNFQKEELNSDTYDLTAEYEGDRFNIRAIAGRTKAEGGPTEQFQTGYYTSDVRLVGDGPETFVSSAKDFASWNINEDGIFGFEVDPELNNNLAAGIGGNPDLGQVGSTFVLSEVEGTYAQLDADFDVNWGPITTLRAGGKFREVEIHRETNNVFFVPPDRLAALEADLNNFNDGADNYRNIGGVPALTDVLLPNGVQNIPGGFNVNVFPGVDMQRYRSLVLENFVQWRRREPNFVYNVEEQNLAGYLQADYEIGNFRGNFGLRYVNIESDISSSDIIRIEFDLFDDDLSTAPDGGVLLPENQRAFETFTTLARENDEEHWLPSFNLAWDATDNFVARFAFANTIARPQLNSLGAQQNLNFTSAELVDDNERFTTQFPRQEGWEGSGGNKNLRSFESRNFDLSFEYYFDDASAFGVALFHKKVDNFIVPLIIGQAPLTFDGVTADQSAVEGVTFADGSPFTFPAGEFFIRDFSTVGNGTNATSKGIELFGQYAFDNGFGLSANYTINDTNRADVNLNGEKVGESPLIGSSDFQLNTSAYYENDRLSARIAFNRRGKRVLGISNGLTIVEEPYQQVDANVGYVVRDNITLTGSVINLTKEEEYSRLGEDTDSRTLNNLYSGRRFYFGANYKF